MIAPPLSWGVTYGPLAVGAAVKGKPLMFPAWSFWRVADTPTPRSDLKTLFLKLAEAMGDTQEEQDRAH